MFTELLLVVSFTAGVAVPPNARKLPKWWPVITAPYDETTARRGAAADAFVSRLSIRNIDRGERVFIGRACAL